MSTNYDVKKMVVTISVDGRECSPIQVVKTCEGLQKAKEAMAVYAMADAERMVVGSGTTQDVKLRMVVGAGLPEFAIYLYADGECYREIWWGVWKSGEVGE